MDIVGISELKTHLTRHLKRVQAGARLGVSNRGRIVAIISPVEASADISWANRLAAQGRAHWSGGKPVGSFPPVRITAGRTVSEAVLKGRGEEQWEL